MFNNKNGQSLCLVASLIYLCGLQALADNPLAQAPVSAFKTEADLNKEIARLDKVESKYDALNKLIDYAAPELFRVGSIFEFTEHPDWVNRAASAVRKYYKDENTLAYCMDHGTTLAKEWAIRSCQSQAKLIPHLIALAVNDPDTTVRTAALEKLPPLEKTKVLDQLKSHHQTDPFVLESLYGNEADFDAKLLELLKDKNEQIRISALLFIAADGKMGLTPSPNHTFNGDLFNEIIKLTKASTSNEKSAAASALDRMKAYDPSAAKVAFLRLSHDSDPDVRWRCAYGLVGQRGQKDVDEMFSALMKDPSPQVRLMTINSLPDKSKYQKELASLSNTANDLMKGGPVVPVNSAAATAWIEKPDTPQSFLLLHSTREIATRPSKQDLKNKTCDAIRAYSSRLREHHETAKAEEIDNRLALYLADFNKPDIYQQLRHELNASHSSEKENDIYVVSAGFESFTDVGKHPWERHVRLCNTGAPVSLMLLCGDQEGAKWRVDVDPGANLKSIVISGNGNANSSVSGNFPKSTQILQKEPDGSPFTVSYNDQFDGNRWRSRMFAFASAHLGGLPLTIQLRRDPAHGAPSTSKPIVVGQESADWRESLADNLIERLYNQALVDKNEEFRKNFNPQFPLLMFNPTAAGWSPLTDFSIGWCSHLKAKIKAKITGAGELAASSYVGLAYNPKAQQTFFASRKQVFAISDQGVARDILPAEMAKLFESDVIQGFAFDTKRNRLVVASCKIVLAFSPDTQKWNTLSFENGPRGIACYNAGDDSLYTRDEGYICRLNPETGKLIQSGYLPLGESMFLKQVYVQGEQIIFVSESYPVPKGIQQLATVIDKRDGSVLYQDACNFVSTR